MSKLSAASTAATSALSARRVSASRTNAPIRPYGSRNVVAVYLILELSLLSMGGVASLYLYPYATMNWSQSVPLVVFSALTTSVALVTWSLLRDHYRRCVLQSGVAAVGTAVAASLRASALLLAVVFALKLSDGLSRASIFCLVCVVTVISVFGRAFLNFWSQRMIASGRMVTDRTIVLGEASRLALAGEKRGFFDKLRGDGVKIVSAEAWTSHDGCRDLLSSVIAKSRAATIDSVILLPTASTVSIAENIVDALAETPLTIHVVPFALTTGPKPAGTGVGGQPSILITNSPMMNISSVLKRAFDVVAASTMLFLLAPLLVGVAAAIKLESRGPVFFRQTRHGYGNCHFRVFKFRSMCVMEDGVAFRQATRNDARITRVGRFIRRSNLDELPQLLNVILGDMSLVGPRPHPVALNDDFAARIRMFHRRHNIRPGITGWAQVNGFRGETDTESKMQKRIDHDLWYVDHWSFLLDLRILIFTVVSPKAYMNAG